jgi:hypothetical protein
MGHVKALEKTSCKYPIRRVEVKVDTDPRGNMNYVQDNMFLGNLENQEQDSQHLLGVSFSVFLSGYGISFVLIHLSRTGIESHITANITCDFVPSLHTLLDHVHLFINIYRMFTNIIHAIMAIVYRYLNTLNFVLVI